MTDWSREMDYSSIEEKIIFEKLTLGGRRPDSRGETPTFEPAEAGTQQVGEVMIRVSEAIATMEATRVNHAHRPLRSVRKVIGGAIVFVKRVVRKCLKWYIEPVCFQQTDFNDAATVSVSGLKDLIMELSQKYNELQQSQEELQQSQEELQQSQEELQQIQNVESSQINAVQDKMGKLNELGLEIFSESGDPKDKGSFAQTGEDMILDFIFYMLDIPIDRVDYLDLGANHAREMSNTYRFYKRGARGVLVEANPDLIPELKFFRGEDLVLNRCVAEKSGETVEFYILNGDGLSTTDRAGAEECMTRNPSLKIERIISVETISVNDIIDKHIGEAPTILNVDIEGNEMGILKSIDFERYRPVAVIVEMIPYKTSLVVGEKNEEILSFMEDIGYTEYAFTGINSIFLDKERLLGRE